MKLDYRRNRNQDYEINCLTVENNKLSLDRLRFASITPHILTVQMICYGKLKHIKTKDFPENLRLEKPKLYYLELEGLQMEFCDFTEETKYRNGKEIVDFNKRKRDYTTSLLRFQNHPYNQLFYKDLNSDNIVIEFPDDTNNTLFYEKFCEIKDDYISVLSFFNGAKLKIRKECTGSYYSIGKIDSEIVIRYSFLKIKNQRFNKYIPLNDPFSRSQKILNKLFVFCFDNYVNWNDKLDLNTIIYFLNNSEKVGSIDERIFIQIIAFERLTTRYAEYLGENEEFKPSRESFEPIKKKLYDIVDEHKNDFGDAYAIVKSKIGNINQIKKLSTKEKMYKLIQDVNIPITSRICDLIDNVRNKTIHQGDIGNGNEALVNYYLLDELIREIVLRLIKYDGPRESMILLNNINMKS
ncbi:MAG: hypothetical protein M0R39_16830 [Prolixibacteraceae bacterium]|nr:hypothetical protein [Prolixibacteraceae bacterium]